MAKEEKSKGKPQKGDEFIDFNDPKQVKEFYKGKVERAKIKNADKK